MIRALANILIIISIIALPWWAVLAFLITFSFFFDFFEIIIYGVVLDSLYAVHYSLLFSHMFFLIAVVVYASFTLIRPNLRSV